MNPQGKSLPNALKHGAFSNLAVLPGEDPAEFKKLHDKLVAEYKADDPIDQDIVTNIARLIWRKQNMASYGLAAAAHARVEKINGELIPRQRTKYTVSLPSYEEPVGEPPTPEEIRAGAAAAKEQIHKELGEFAKLAEMSGSLTFDNLHKELSLIDRIDGMIDRCLKRLLFIRGLKSITASASGPASGERLRPEVKRLPAA
jgi:hypothetical protein